MHSRLDLLALTTALALLPGAASALALGEAQLQSRYGQPLQLWLPVELAGEDELSDAALIQARLMGADYYAAQGVAEPELPASELSVRTELRDGRPWVLVSSLRPLREPLLTLFVNVRLGASQITREVPVLLEFQDHASLNPAPAPVPQPAPEASAPLPAPATVAPVSALPPATVDTAPAAAPARRSRTRRAGVPAAVPTASPGLAAVAAEASLDRSRPEGYTRFRLDPSFASFRQRKDAASIPVVAAPTIEPPEPLVDSQPRAASEPAPAQPLAGEARGLSWWTYLFVLLVGALAYGLARRSRAKPPYIDIASLPGRYQTHYDQRTAPAEPGPSVAPPPAVEVRPAVPAEPLMTPDIVLEPDPPLSPASAAPTAAETEPVARASYPHQDLRERVAQLAKLLTQAADKRKLELVKAYIDVGRADSAEKLLAEIEQKQHGPAKPELLDFELN